MKVKHMLLILTVCMSFAMSIGIYGAENSTRLSYSSTKEWLAQIVQYCITNSAIKGVTEPVASASSEQEKTQMDLRITIGDEVFYAKLYENDATKNWVAQMPMTLDMSDMNRNEKYYYMTSPLPTNAESPGQIHTGDIMLYGEDCLVLFYEDFSSAYSYTRLGYMEDTTGLANALGTGNVQVSFQPE